MARNYGYNSAHGIDSSIAGGGAQFLYDGPNSNGQFDSNNFQFKTLSTPATSTLNGNGGHGTCRGRDSARLPAAAYIRQPAALRISWALLGDTFDGYGGDDIIVMDYGNSL